MAEREFQQAVQGFIRAFGLLEESRTPCGQPLPVSQAHALQVLTDDGPMRQQDLASRIGVEKSTASRLVSQLEARGWVRRVVNPASRREYRVELTEEGRRMGATVSGAALLRCGAVLSRIPAAKRGQVLEALSLLTDAVKDA